MLLFLDEMSLEIVTMTAIIPTIALITSKEMIIKTITAKTGAALIKEYKISRAVPILLDNFLTI